MYSQIIAEIGANHCGDMALAVDMINTAAASGVDIVKFQSWQADKLVKTYPEYTTMYDYYKKHELTDDDHFLLYSACKEAGVAFLTTCFDIDRIAFLSTLGLSMIKVASPDLASHSLLKKLRNSFEHIIISTGMSYPEEIAQTAEIMKGHFYTYLHCVSQYPTSHDEVNLARMDWLKQFTPSVGFSDHTAGPQAAEMAIARGAAFIEKHFTLDRSLPGRDQKISSEPDVFKDIASFRDECTVLYGSEEYDLKEKEARLRDIYIGKWGNNR